MPLSMMRAADDQRHRIPHRDQIGRDIDHVGKQQQTHDQAQQRARSEHC